jgi:cytochrome c oxidase subunit II
MRRGALQHGSAVLLALLAGCSRLQHQQTMLRPAGPMSQRIEALWWFIFAICLAAFVLMMASLTAAAARRGTHQLLPPDIRPDPALERRRLRVVIGLLAITTVLLFSMLAYSVVTGPRLNSPSSKSPLSIQVIGHRWWWEVQYPNSDASQWVVTANEIHVPVGVPVVVETSSRDVIHSFWAPNIQGKRDLIPGYNNAFWFEAKQEGTYRGQCAEFCGFQHAHMAFYLIAESPEKFQAWLNGQVKPAPDPNNDVLKRGQQVFLGTTCIMCHTIRGTSAGSRVGPDLTHIGSRLSIGAATLPNTPGALGGWIADAPSIKPGVIMPPNPLPSEDLQALVAYLTSLK